MVQTSFNVTNDHSSCPCEVRRWVIAGIHWGIVWHQETGKCANEYACSLLGHFKQEIPLSSGGLK